MEEKLNLKMAELMTAMDEVRRFREITVSMGDVAVIMALTVVAALALQLFALSARVFLGFTFSNVPFFIFVTVLIGILVSYVKLDRRTRAVPIGLWRNTLAEGAPGAIKLLQEFQWDNVFGDIRLAKVGFAIYGVARTMVFWLIMALVLSPFGNLLTILLHVNSNTVTLTIVPLALLLILFLTRRDMAVRYGKITSLDSLLWELRWFDSEFRRADFKT